MAKALVTAGGSGALLAANATQYVAAANADIATSTTESRTQILYRAPGTVTKLSITLSANNRGASTCTFRKNAADGNQAVSIASSSGAGVFQDTASADAVAAADKCGIKLVAGAAGSAWTCRAVGTMFAATTNTVVPLFTHDPTGVTIGAVTRYVALTGVLVPQTLETFAGASVQANLGQAQTLQTMSVTVSGNSRNSATVFTLRKNGADAGPTVSVASSSGAGSFEDTVNTASLAAGDDVNWKIVGGGSTGTFTLVALKIESESTTGKAQLLSHDVSAVAFSTASTTRYFGIGLIAFSATESDAQHGVPEAVTLSEMHVVLSANTRATTTTFGSRKNTGTGTLLVSVAASSGAGVFTDVTHSDAYAATDRLNFYMATSTGTGSFMLNSVSTLGGTSGDQTITVSGTLTPAGLVVHQPAQALTGATTPVGALSKILPRVFASVTPSAGALKRQPAKAAAGTLTPAGALKRQPAKAAAGTVTPAGALKWLLTTRMLGTVAAVGLLTKRLTRAIAGSCTPTGALTRALTYTRAFSGTVAPAGTLRVLLQRLLQGVSALLGTLVQIPVTTATGTIGSTGALTQERATVLALAGTIGSTGLLTKGATLRADALLLLTGALLQRPDHRVHRTLDPAGTLQGTPVLPSSGVVGLAGAMVTEGSTAVLATGTIVGTGALRARAEKALARDLALVGALVALVDKKLEGFLTMSGELLRWELTATLPGSVVPLTGALTWDLDSATHTGALVPSGTLGAQVDMAFASTLTPVGVAIAQQAQGLSAAGLVTPIGAIGPWTLAREIYSNAVTLTSTLKKDVAVACQGLVVPLGAHAVQVSLGLASVVGAAGTLVFASVTAILLTGVVGLTGTLLVTFATIRGRISLYVRRLRGGGLDPRDLTGGGLTDREID